MSDFGDKIRRERKRRGWTLKDVAKRLGLKNHTTYANYEYGEREPDIEMIKRIADLYELPAEHLVPTSTVNSGIEQETFEILRDINALPPDKKQIILGLLESWKK